MSKIRVANTVGAYEHEEDSVLEEIVNFDTWEEVQKVLQKQK